MIDDYEISEDECPNCKHYPTRTRTCGCDDGYSHHDCGEDCCMCLYPVPNVVCDECEGREFYHWCSNCGWDLNQKRFINGKDEREKVKA